MPFDEVFSICSGLPICVHVTDFQGIRYRKGEVFRPLAPLTAGLDLTDPRARVLAEYHGRVLHLWDVLPPTTSNAV